MNNVTSGATPARRMTLSTVKKGVLARPLRTFVYGVEKIGKSSFALGAPDPVFLGTEEGTSQLDAQRFPEEPRSWNDLLDGVRAAIDEQHSFKTLVIDTVDWAEPLLFAQLCKENNWKTIESPGYGKGYTAALDQWRILLSLLDRLRSTRGMHVILLGHSVVKSFSNPEGDNYDRFIPKMNEKAAGLIKEWCDDVLFANYETFTVASGTKKIGVSSGARIIHTERRAAFDAGNRHSLPETLPLSWSDYFDAVQAHQSTTPEKFRERITAMLRELNDPELNKTVPAFLEKAGDNTNKLAEAANRLAARLVAKQKEGENQ